MLKEVTSDLKIKLASSQMKLHMEKKISPLLYRYKGVGKEHPTIPSENKLGKSSYLASNICHHQL